jgi:MFS family permease
MTVFAIAFLKGPIGMSESSTLYVSSVAFLGGFFGLSWLGPRVDRWGSKPVLLAAFAGWAGVLGGWTLLAAGVVAPRLGVVLGLEFAMGLGAAMVNMANTRLAMVVVPPMGRNHFFAIFSVANNVVLGLSPVLWGVLLDACARLDVHALGFHWNQFSVFFAVVGLLFAGAGWFGSRLIEPTSASLDRMLRELLVQSPQRFWLRWWPRS